MFRVPECLRLPMLNLGRIIDNAVELAETLLATDFTADYLPRAQHPARGVSTPEPAPPPAPAPATAEPRGTPFRTGAAVQAARAVCEKLSSALAATEAARLSTHIANLKVTNTPPQLRYLPPQHLHQANGRCGNATSRELRFCPEASPVRSSACFPLGSSLMAVASPGFATARGPRSTPLVAAGAAAVAAGAPGLPCGPAASAAAATIAERPSPLRPLLTARPSRPTGVPSLMLQGTGASYIHPPAAQVPLQQQQQPPLQQQQQQPPRPGFEAAAASAGVRTPPVPRLTISLPHRFHAAAAATDGADGIDESPMPLGSPFSSSSAQPTPVLITSGSPSPPIVRRLGGPVPAVQSGPPAAMALKSPPKAAAAATGVTPPCDAPPPPPPRASPKADKPAAAMPGKGMPPRPVPALAMPSLRLPLQEGTAVAGAGAPLPSSRWSCRDGAVYTGRGGSEDGVASGSGVEERRPAGPRPAVPNLRLGSVAR